MSRKSMYCISDAEYIRDFTMMLNDDILDCFTEKVDTKAVVSEKEKEIEVVYKEFIEIPAQRYKRAKKNNLK